MVPKWFNNTVRHSCASMQQTPSVGCLRRATGSRQCSSQPQKKTYENRCRYWHERSKQRAEQRNYELECRSHVMSQWQRHQSEINLRIETRSYRPKQNCRLKRQHRQKKMRDKKGLLCHTKRTAQPANGARIDRKDSDENKNRMEKIQKQFQFTVSLPSHSLPFSLFSARSHSFDSILSFRLQDQRFLFVFFLKLKYGHRGAWTVDTMWLWVTVCVWVCVSVVT